MPIDLSPLPLSVLLVEDDAEARTVLGNILARRFPVLTLAENGEEGLRQYERLRPDIVVSDIMMPRLNGIDMARGIRQINPEAVVILVTAHSETERLLEAIAIGVNHYVLKPIDTRALFQALDKCAQTIRDRRRLRELEEECLKLHKQESLSVFAGGLAHDFNNLLMVIMGYISLAREQQSLHLLDKAENACRLARGLTQQLLSLSRGGQINKVLTFLPEFLATEVAANLAGTAVRAALAIAPDLRPVELDGDPFRQVIHNVVQNAVEAMPEGGEMEVEASSWPMEEGNAFALPPGSYVRITIRDHGRGIDEAILPKVFDPYFSTKEMGRIKGQGLGLTISHAIIRKHGGAMALRAAPGGGTACDIYLPVAQG